MDTQRRRYSVEELRALRARAPPLPPEEILRLSNASLHHVRESSLTAPNLVPVDSAWLRPHPLLGEFDAALEPERSPKHTAKTKQQKQLKPQKLLKQPKQPTTPPPGFGPAPGFGPVPTHLSAQQHRTRTDTSNPPRAPSPPAASHKSRIARGPDLSRNFATRIAFRDKSTRAKKPISPLPSPKNPTPPNPSPVHQSQSRQKPGVKASFSVSAGESFPPLPGNFAPIDVCRTSAEIDRLFAAPISSSQREAPAALQQSNTQQPQDLRSKNATRPPLGEQASDELARWFLDLSVESTAPKNYSSKADKNPVIGTDTRAATLPVSSSGPKVGSKPASTEQPLAPNVLSFFDSIRSQASSIGRKTNTVASSLSGPRPQRNVSPRAKQYSVHNQTEPSTNLKSGTVSHAPSSGNRDGIDSESVRNFFDMFSNANQPNGKTFARPMPQPSQRPYGLGNEHKSPDKQHMQNMMPSNFQSHNHPRPQSLPDTHALSRQDMTSHAHPAQFTQAVPLSRMPPMARGPAYPHMMFPAPHSRPPHPHPASLVVSHGHASDAQLPRPAAHTAHQTPPSVSIHGTHGPFLMAHQGQAHGMHPHGMAPSALPGHPGHGIMHQQRNQLQHLQNFQHIQQRRHAQHQISIPNGGMTHFAHVPPQHSAKAMPVPIHLASVSTVAAGGAAATPPRTDTGGDLQRWFTAISDANRTR